MQVIEALKLPQLAQIKQPVLIVNGSDDSLAPTLESVTLFQPQLFFARVSPIRRSAIRSFSSFTLAL